MRADPWCLGRMLAEALPTCRGMVVSDELPKSKGFLERELEKVNFFFENLSLLPETSAAMEHFKLVFGSGTSDPVE